MPTPVRFGTIYKLNGLTEKSKEELRIRATFDVSSTENIIRNELTTRYGEVKPKIVPIPSKSGDFYALTGKDHEDFDEFSLSFLDRLEFSSEEELEAVVIDQICASFSETEAREKVGNEAVDKFIQFFKDLVSEFVQGKAQEIVEVSIPESVQ